MTNTCIMKPNDYIAAADVNKLTADQWQQFREYLRGYGHRIDEESGQRGPLYGHWCVILDAGDLIWCDGSSTYNNQVTYEQIMETIQQKCIMKIDDYVCGGDASRLTGTQWEQFREYLKSHGYRVANGYGHYGSSYSDKWRVVLDEYGDLVWYDDSSPYGNRITYEQIIRVIQSQSSEPLHVQARNRHINEIKQLIELHEELITRLHNTGTIGVKASIDHHQQQIEYLRKSLDEAKHRCSGRTTNIALKTIAQAAQCPKQNIPIRDHHDTAESHRHLASMIELMLAKLQLTGFVIDRFKLTLRYQGL